MIRPTGDKVLIRPDANPEQTASGLFLVEHRKPDVQGVVVALGKGVIYTELCVGDHVVFSWASGQDIEVEGEPLIVMRDVDVLAVLEDV